MNTFIKSILTCATFCMLSVSVGGCCTTNGLVKTPLDDRVRADYPTLGISIALPKKSTDMCAKYALDVEDSPAFQSNACMKAEMYIEMHYVWAGANVEPTPMLDFFIARLTPKEYADLLKGDEIYLNRVFGNKLKAFQSVVVIYSIAESHSWRHFLVFRKDVQLKDGDVVVAGARLVDNKGVVPNKEEDVKSITEILNSITSLEN